MNLFKPSRRTLLASVGATCILALGQGAVGAESIASAANYSFVEGSANQLSGVKRVIVSDFVVVFQLDGSVRNNNETRIGSMTLFGRNAKEVAAKMSWKNPDTAAMQDIADAGLAALKARFKANGIEVLDESLLTSQPAYASILEATGLKNLEDYSIVNVSEADYRKGNNGTESVSEAKIVSAKGSAPYGHSVFEGGLCCHVRKGYPSSKAYYVPGFEIDIAKGLDAAVVKVWQYVYFTQVDAGVRQDGWAGGVGGAVVNFSASAKSVLRIGEQKTRISLRLPTSTNKTRNTPTTWLPNDGDVVISLSKPVLIGDQYYRVEDSGTTAGQDLRASLGGTQNFNFAATLNDPAAYKRDLGQGMGTVLDGLVTTAFGQIQPVAATH
jgi:hypothetical protein